MNDFFNKIQTVSEIIPALQNDAANLIKECVEKIEDKDKTIKLLTKEREGHITTLKNIKTDVAKAGIKLDPKTDRGLDQLLARFEPAAVDKPEKRNTYRVAGKLVEVPITPDSKFINACNILRDWLKDRIVTGLPHKISEICENLSLKESYVYQIVTYLREVGILAFHAVSKGRVDVLLSDSADFNAEIPKSLI